MIMKTMPILALIISLCWIGQAEAQYVLVLNNGRQITVQSYREETGMIKFHGFGGEIGISKDQVRTIRKAGEADSAGLNPLGSLDAAAPPGAPESQSETAPTSAPTAEKTINLDEERAREEKEYQQKLIDLTGRLKEINEGYSQSIRGTTSPDPNQQWTEEQRGATRDDVISRYREATSNPSEPSPVKLLTPSPFSSLPPSIVDDRPAKRAPTYFDAQQLPETERQRDLSEMRNQAIQLEKERERLINEMKQKNFGAVKIIE